MKENKIVLFTKYLLNFMFCTGILAAASLPYTLKLASELHDGDFFQPGVKRPAKAGSPIYSGKAWCSGCGTAFLKGWNRCKGA